MKTVLWIGLLMSSLPSAMAMPQSDFDGTWRIDVDKSVFPSNPEILLLQNGMYQCKTCNPAISAKADGEDHNVSGSPYYDAISVRVVDDRTIETTEKKDGKPVATCKMMAAPDGSTATFEFSDSSDTDHDPVVGKGTMTRVAKSKRLPTGAHGISGSWRISKMETLSDNALLFTLKVEGDTFTMTNPTGQSYTAKLDGSDAPYKGDAGIDSVSVVRMSQDTLMETDKRNGRVIRSKRMMVTPGEDKSMHIIVTDTVVGSATVLAAEKQ